MQWEKISVETFKAIFGDVKSEGHCFINPSLGLGLTFTGQYGNYVISLSPIHLPFNIKTKQAKIGDYTFNASFADKENKDNEENILRSLAQQYGDLDKTNFFLAITVKNNTITFNVLDKKLLSAILQRLKKHGVIDEDLLDNLQKLAENPAAQQAASEDNNSVDYLHKVLTSSTAFEKPKPFENLPLIQHVLTNYIKKPSIDKTTQEKFTELFHAVNWPELIIEYLDANREKIYQEDVLAVVLKLLEALPSNITFKFLAAIIAYPSLVKKLTPIFSQLKFIQIRDGGESRDNWSALAKLVFQKMEKFDYDDQRSPASNELLTQLEQASPDLNDSNIASLLEQGWKFYRFQGRTILLTHDKNTEVLALKFQKKGENIMALHRQKITVDYLNQNKTAMKLKSELPQAMAVEKINGIQEWLEGLVAARQTNPTDVEQFFNAIETSDAKEFYVYKYRAKQDYFTYLHDPSVSDEKFFPAVETALHDLIVLLNQGMVYTNIADIFHNLDIKRPDGGRYITLINLIGKVESGSGKLGAWRKATEFLNLRLSGIADEGDWDWIDRLANEQSEFVYHYFRNIHQIHHEKTPAVMLANFLAEYFLVIELCAGHRLCRLIEEKNVPNTLKLWEDTVRELHRIFTQRFIQFTGLPEKTGQNLFHAMEDIATYARQMQYWMSNLYLKNMEAEKNSLAIKIPSEIYGKSVVVETGKFREGTVDRLNGFSEDTKKGNDLGTVNGPNPIKSGDKQRYDFITFGFAARMCRIFAERALNEGVQSVNQENHEAAVKHFAEAVAYAPTSINCRNRLFYAGEKLSLPITPQNNTILEQNKKELAALKIQRAWHFHKNKKQGCPAVNSETLIPATRLTV